jgi:hypothetical protein
VTPGCFLLSRCAGEIDQCSVPGCGGQADRAFRGEGSAGAGW